jgi:hypothetical protein
MKQVAREEVLDLVQYELQRDAMRDDVIARKRVRRVGVGSNMTLLFENHATVLFQIQEMLRTERIVKEPSILHELETYNELIPASNELSATAFVEYPDAEERDRMLVALAGLEPCFFVEVDGQRAPGRNETRAILPDRTTAVHYVKFPLSQPLADALRAGSTRVSVGVDHPRYQATTQLSPETIAELRGDLV